MRHPPFHLALAALVLATPAVAQDSGGQGAYGGGPSHGPSGAMRGREGMPAPDPVVLQGPPAPAELARIVDLPQDRLDRYTRLYDRFMTATKPQRDSLAALRRGMRDAFADRDREAIRRQRAVMEPIARDLREQQATFDDSLHGLLAEPQWKRYQQWREDERKRADQERRDRWQRRAG
jgi:hypothetical protein